MASSLTKMISILEMRELSALYKTLSEVVYSMYSCRIEADIQNMNFSKLFLWRDVNFHDAIYLVFVFENA